MDYITPPYSKINGEIVQAIYAIDVHISDMTGEFRMPGSINLLYKM